MIENESVGYSVNQAWGTTPLNVAYCEHCSSAYLTATNVALTVCPSCLQTGLGSQTEQMRREAPELVIPFALGKSRVQDALTDWCKGVWFRPGELNAQVLGERLQRYLLPLWLVDGDVGAVWQAELGYNYDAASFREHFSDGQWVSQEIIETRIRWEPRVGKLNRHYDNVAVPALREHQQWMARLGGYNLRAPRPYSEHVIEQSVVRIPDYGPETAWLDAESALNRSAASECQLAGGGDHIRNWSMHAQFTNLNWTQLLVPAYVSYYQERESVYPVWVNGQNGHVYGLKLMSMQKAVVSSLIIGVVAVLCFLLGLVLTVIGIGIALILLSLPLGLSAFAPIIWAWTKNRQAQRQLAEL